MRKSKSSLMLGMVISIVLVSCYPAHEISSTQTHLVLSSPVPTQTKTSTPTLPVPTAAVTATTVPTQTPTPTPTETITLTSLITTFQESGWWNFSHPYSDPNRSGLFQVTSDGYQLDPSFQPETIDLSYQWWGLGDPSLHYQRLDRRDFGYWNGSTTVSYEAIKKLIRSISHLHPQPQMLNAITHTDDYPVWAIELVNADGNHILIYSDSNTSNFAPWNVIFNGQIYTQFDGQITEALSKIFIVVQGQPMAFTSIGDAQESHLNVDSIGWPGQLSDGFNGLLAVQGGFHYWVVPQDGAIQGYLKGRSSINGAGNMIIGSITGLTSIEVDAQNGQTVACTLKSIASNDPEAYVWQFTCPVVGPNAKGNYRFPIRVTFKTDKETIYTQSGELFGDWEQGTMLPAITVPEEISQILQGSPALQDLLTDHTMTVVNFSATVDPVKGNMDDQWAATVALLGRLETGNRVIPYTVTTRIAVENSKLAHWSLDRSKLESLLEDVANQTITRRSLDEIPDLVLNLYYEEGNVSEFGRMYLWACGNLPVADVPKTDQPLRGFAFNQSWDFGGIQILLINGKPRLMSYSVQPSDPVDAVWVSLLPKELLPADVMPFDEIYIYGWAPVVIAVWNPNASQSDIDAYKVLAGSK